MPVQGDDFSRPNQLVDHALPSGLRRRPQFKILYPVVGPVAVLVVDRFGVQQLAANVPLHEQSVFGHVATVVVNRAVARL